jgi:hypothetical protein
MIGWIGEPPRQNPLSPVAIAAITGHPETDPFEPTIETAALRQASVTLAGYLGADPAELGTVIAVIGDPGTGKTHLAAQLIGQGRRALRDPAMAMYLDATSRTFVDLYRRFVHQLTRARIRDLVNGCYADVVAESLLDRGFGDDIAAWLRAGEVTPQQVVERLGLMESALLRDARRRLHDLTGEQDFSIALTLLLRQGFGDAVWTWLSGEPPPEILQERGITTSITSELAAIDAMGVLALLHGARRERFLLVIDDLDEILGNVARLRTDTAAAFRRLLEVFAAAGGCLVLAGGTELHEALGPQTWERVSHVVHTNGLSADEVSSFIELAPRMTGNGAFIELAQRTTGHGEPELFTPESVRYLTVLTNGNPRDMIRLCYEAFRLVADRIRGTGDHHALVTEEIVREAARQRLVTHGTADVLGAIRQVLDANGWAYLPSHFLGTGPESRADFWVTFDDRADGCAILVTGLVLASEDAAGVVRRIFAVRDAVPGSAVVLVVNGVLAEPYAEQFREPLGVEPLVYSERRFPASFAALVSGARNRLVGTADDSMLTTVRRRLDQINQQQSSIFGLLEQVADQLDGARGSSDRGLTAIQRDVTALTGMIAGAVRSRPAPEPTPVGLPSEVDRLFLDAVSVLEELSQLDEMMSEAFEHSDTELSNIVEQRLIMPRFLEAMGTVLLMRRNVLAFRSAVGGWYAIEVSGASDAPSADALERLSRLCRAYRNIADVLPMSNLEPLFTLLPWTARRGAASERSQPNRRIRVRRALTDLSLRVRTAVHDSAAFRAS